MLIAREIMHWFTLKVIDMYSEVLALNLYPEKTTALLIILGRNY